MVFCCIYLIFCCIYLNNFGTLIWAGCQLLTLPAGAKKNLHLGEKMTAIGRWSLCGFLDARKSFDCFS